MKAKGDCSPTQVSPGRAKGLQAIEDLAVMSAAVNFQKAEQGSRFKQQGRSSLRMRGISWSSALLSELSPKS